MFEFESLSNKVAGPSEHFFQKTHQAAGSDNLIKHHMITTDRNSSKFNEESAFLQTDFLRAINKIFIILRLKK